MYPPHCHPSLGSSSDRQTSRPGSGCRLSWRCRCFWRRGRRTGTIAPAVSSCPVGSSCLQFYIKTTNITSVTETLKYTVLFIVHNSTQHLIFIIFQSPAGETGGLCIVFIMVCQSFCPQIVFQLFFTIIIWQSEFKFPV